MKPEIEAFVCYLSGTQFDDSDADCNTDSHCKHLDSQKHYTCHDDVSTRRDVIAADAAR